MAESKNEMELFYDEMILKIQSLISDSGKKSPLEDSEIENLAKKICREIADNYSAFRLQEIELAFNLGLKKEFGEYYGINFVTLSDWLKAYKYSQFRTDFINEITPTQNMLQENVELSDSEKLKISKKGLVNKFNDYKNNDRLTDLGNTSYLWLEENEFFTLSIEKKKKIFEISKKEAAKKTQASKDSKRNSFSKIVKTSPISEARLLVLKAYFDCLIKQKIDIALMIETGEVIEVDIVNEIEKRDAKKM